MFFPTIETQNYPYVLTGNSEQTFYTALIKQILDRQNKAQFHEPSFYVSLFSKIRDSKEPIRLIITGLAVGFNKLVSIENSIMIGRKQIQIHIMISNLRFIRFMQLITLPLMKMVQ